MKAPQGLRELRERRLLSINELSKRTGVAHETITRLESGEGSPQPRTLRKLADGLGVGYEELYEESAAPKAVAPPSPKPEVSEERRFVVRGWTIIFEDLAARYEKVEEELRTAQVEEFPENVVDIRVLASYNFLLLGREAEEVQSADGVIKATEKVRGTQARIERLIEQKFGPLSTAHAAQLDRFRAANAAASPTSDASMQEAEDERRGIS